MDTNQLITIAVTAVVSIIARELITWLFAGAKSLSASKEATVKVKTIFTKTKTARTLIWDLANLGFSIFVLASKFRRTDPIDRWEVFLITLLSFGIMFWLSKLAFDLGRWSVRRQENIDSK